MKLPLPKEMPKECIVCGNKDELRLKIVEYNIKDKWWMCLSCLENKNDEWSIAKERYYANA